MWETVSAIAISVLAISATVTGIFAYRNLRQYREEFRLSTYTLLLREISGEEASRDRSMVRESVKRGELVGNIKTCVTAFRRNEVTKNAEIGGAVERTIACLDRVGIFLLGDRDKPRIKPPKWLWTMVRDIWERLGIWVEYRQDYAEDEEFWQEGYGYYFRRLAEVERQRTNQHKG